MTIITPQEGGFGELSINSNNNKLIENKILSTKFKFIINKKWIYNSHSHILTDSDQLTLKLRAKTSEVLNLLLIDNGNIVLTQQFFEKVWCDKYVSENVLKQSIRELRSSFSDDSKQLIRTVPKQGYCLNADIEIFNLPRNGSTGYLPKNIEQQPGMEEPIGEELDIDENKINSIDKPSWIKCQKQKLLTKKSLKNYLALTVTFVAGTILSALFNTSYTSNEFSNELNNETKKLAVLSESNYFYNSVFLKLQDSDFNNLKSIKSVFDKFLVESESYSNIPLKKEGIYNALFDWYFISGFYIDARLVLGRLQEHVESLYKDHSVETFEVKFKLIDVLIKLRRRQEAYEVARLTLKDIKEFQPKNKTLLAHSYYHSANAHLMCIEPFCERKNSLLKGELHARKALELYQQQFGVNSIKAADTMWLLNWFIWDKDEKIALSENSAKIYESTYGELNEKVASSIEELARTLSFFKHEFKKSEDLLLKAYSIRKKLYPARHPVMAKINGYLGEHYFMLGMFDKSIDYLNRAISITVHTRGEANNARLEYLMLLARAHLYSNRAFDAKKVIDMAYRTIDSYQMTPSVIVEQALLTTRSRVQLAISETVPEYYDLLEKINNTKDIFKSLKSTVQHEYYSQLLEFYPTATGEQYLENLNNVLKDITPKNRYFYLADADYIKQRAALTCIKKSLTFCDRIKELFEDNQKLHFAYSQNSVK